MHTACLAGNKDIFEILLSTNKFDLKKVNEKNQIFFFVVFNWTVLHCVCFSDSEFIFRLLDKQGLDYNVVDIT